MLSHTTLQYNTVDGKTTNARYVVVTQIKPEKNPAHNDETDRSTTIKRSGAGMVFSAISTHAQ